MVQKIKTRLESIHIETFDLTLSLFIAVLSAPVPRGNHFKVVYPFSMWLLFLMLEDFISFLPIMSFSESLFILVLLYKAIIGK